MTTGQTTKSHTKRNVAAITVMVLVTGIALLGLSYEFNKTAAPQTWQQWGMSIRPPAGLTAQGQGVYQQLATPNSGMAIWTWNGGNTSLDLEWIPASVSNYSSGFQPVPIKLQGHSITGIVAVSQGNVSMAGATWKYQTSRLTVGGLTIYETSATSYYPSSQRGYLLAYVDTNSNTLASLETYGNTFRG